MKVSELIKLLKQTDQNAEVFSARDFEGNGYSPLRGVALADEKGTQVVIEAQHEQWDFDEAIDKLEKSSV